MKFYRLIGIGRVAAAQVKGVINDAEGTGGKLHVSDGESDEYISYSDEWFKAQMPYAGDYVVFAPRAPGEMAVPQVIFEAAFNNIFVDENVGMAVGIQPTTGSDVPLQDPAEQVVPQQPATDTGTEAQALAESAASDGDGPTTTEETVVQGD